jgi:superfamily I DNA/RNA helicase
MAVVSYTNVAKDELEEKIRRLGKANFLLSAPHFVGTIDAFLNQYLFLPFGAAHMGYVGGRPKLVGEPYGQWRTPKAIADNNPKGASSTLFFDCYSVGLTGAFRVDKTPRKSGAYLKPAEEVKPTNASKILKMKQYLWSLGFALQSDANYISYATLTSSEYLTQSFVRRFPVIVVDEAQDMTEVQHAILDHLRNFGQQHIVLIGDEYQAIYEWNTAKPKLFLDKRADPDWNSTSVDETFRCSAAICSFLTNMAADGSALRPAKGGKNENYEEPVQIRPYGTEHEREDVQLAIDELAKSLSDKDPHDGNIEGVKTIAVLARSREGASSLQAQFSGARTMPGAQPVWDDRLTKDYLRVIYHLLNRDLYAAAGAYETILLNGSEYASKTEMRAELQREWANAKSFNPLGYRVSLFEDLSRIRAVLPTSGNAAISDCAAYCDVDLNALSRATLAAIKKDCRGFSAAAKRNQDRSLFSLFVGKDERMVYDHPMVDNVRIVFSTVHGVKGETYDGVIFHTKETTGNCTCSSRTNKWAKVLQHSLVECETKRIAYVALSRAAQMLFVLAPVSSVDAWRVLAQESLDAYAVLDP